MDLQAEGDRMLYRVTQSQPSHLLVEYPLLFRQLHNDGSGIQRVS